MYMAHRTRTLARRDKRIQLLILFTKTDSTDFALHQLRLLKEPESHELFLLAF